LLVAAPAAVARAYAGPALSAGVAYEWRAMVRDDAGEASAWSAWRAFTVNAVGAVSLATAAQPAAKVDGPSGQIDWEGTWGHPSALAANAAQVRVLQGDAVVRVGNEVALAPTVANGGTITVQDTAPAGIGTLQPGVYTYQVRARDTGGSWSPWSPQRAFVVNSVPTTPSNLQPPSGQAATARPLLEFDAYDPDGGDDDTDVQGRVEVWKPGQSLNAAAPNSFVVPNGNYDPALDRFAYPVSAGEAAAWAALLNANGRYWWRCRAEDVSAGANGYGDWSQPQSFDYLAGPTVTVTNPTAGDTEPTSVPTVAATFSQAVVQFRLTLYRQDARDAFKTTGWLAQASGTGLNGSGYQIPKGWLVNEGRYDLVVEGKTAGGLVATSLRIPFKVSYGALAPLTNVQASPQRHRRDYEDSSVLLSWDAANLSLEQFGGYVVRRRLDGQALADAAVVRVVTAIGQTTWTDFHAPPDQPLVYAVSHYRVVGADVVESPPVDVAVELPMRIPTLVSVEAPASVRAALVLVNDDAFGGGFERPENAVETWGSKGRKTFITTPKEFGQETFRVRVTVLGDARGSMLDHFGDVRDCVTSGHAFSFRSGEGERVFVRIADWDWRRSGQYRFAREVDLQLEEVAYEEFADPSA
jgi:hypothetical protein